MEKEIAIRITNLSKKYRVNRTAAKSQLLSKIKTIFNRKKIPNDDEFFALKNVNLTVKKGESLGIIGRNGAGKSTLLKILSEVIEPSEGFVEINGRIASVLEIGMGFHPELTGRENIMLTGIIMGMTYQEINQKFETIRAFSGIKDFINVPVKKYSSGMYLRLAFSIVVNIDADIMLFDEVLSTGDLSYQNKCYEKIEELIKNGKTIILVSHNLNDIIRVCKKIVYFENGSIKFDSQKNSINEYIRDVIDENRFFSMKNSQNIAQSEIRCKEINIDEYESVSDIIKLKRITARAINKSIDDKIYTSDPVELSIDYEKMCNKEYFDIAFTISFTNTFLIYVDSKNSKLNVEEYNLKGNYEISAIIPPNLFNDIYIQIGFKISINSKEIILANKNSLTIKYNEVPSKLNLKVDIPKFIGPIYPIWEWSIKCNND